MAIMTSITGVHFELKVTEINGMGARVWRFELLGTTKCWQI
jgi:hypothetical protein